MYLWSSRWQLWQTPVHSSRPRSSVPAADARLAMNASYCERGTTSTFAFIAACWIPQSS